MTSNENTTEEQKQLEIKKLKKEIAALSLEKWKLILGFIPLIAVLGTISYNLYKLRSEETRHQQSREDSIEGTYFVEYNSYSDHPEQQLDICKKACIDSTRLSKDIRYGYCQKIPELVEKIKEKNRLDSLNDLEQEKDLNNEDSKLAKQLASLDSLKVIRSEEMKSKITSTDPAQANLFQGEIDSLNNKIDSILNQSDVIKKALARTDSINKEQRKISKSPKTSNSGFTHLVEEESWFKKGYYRQYGETRISLIDLKSTRAKISIREIDLKSDQVKNTIETFTLNEGEKKQILIDRFVYEILFQRIGSAGKNPFTKAVFFRYSKYEQ